MMVGHVEIKKMETDDEIRGKAYVHWKSWHEAYPGLVSDEYLEKLTLEKCEKMAYSWPDNLIVAKENGRVIGFVGYGDRGDEAPDTGEIFALYVLSEYYGKGVGLRLIKAGLEQLKGYSRICLWVLKDNKRAIRFYQKCGFAADGEELISPNIGAAEIRMVMKRKQIDTERLILRPWEETDSLIEEISALKKTMPKCAKGSLVLNNSKNSPQWYLLKKNENGKYIKTYLDKSKHDTIEKLARKAYLDALIKDKQNEVDSINAYLKKRKPKDISKFLDINSPYCKLLFNTNWEYEKYPKSNKKPEHLKHPTLKGDMVRSKSEALIANTLFDLQIPYRYEWCSVIAGVPMDPDFTIYSFKKNKYIIWEHIGRVDDPEYYPGMMKKLDTYLSNGYLPGKNLILTFEDSKHPLDIQEVHATIQHYLL